MDFDINHYVSFDCADKEGINYIRVISLTVNERKIKKIPELCNYFWFESRYGIKAPNGEYLHGDKSFDKSGTYFPGGQIITLEKALSEGVLDLNDPFFNLGHVEYIKKNNLHAVKTRIGRYKVFDKEDIILDDIPIDISLD